jgi:hypothetical protein
MTENYKQIFEKANQLKDLIGTTEIHLAESVPALVKTLNEILATARLEYAATLNQLSKMIEEEIKPENKLKNIPKFDPTLSEIQKN